MVRRAAFLMILASLVPLVGAEAEASLKLTKTIALPSVPGRFDHFAFDAAGDRLFVAATGNHSVEIVNVKTGTRIDSLTGLGKPHGLAWVADQGKLFVADGTLAALKIYAGFPLKAIASLPLPDDADDMVYDPQTGLLYVGHGGSSPSMPGRIAVVNTRTDSVIDNLPASAHPEALDMDPKGKRIFANIADSSEIIVIDSTTHSIRATWKLSRAKDNVPIAFDQEDHTLLVGCRTPARSVSVDDATGVEMSDLPSASGADDLFYEPQRHRAYLISGSGAIDVYEVAPDQSLKALDSIKTGPGAKTGLLVLSLKSLFVAVPATSAVPAEIRAYSTEP
jgi:DNA-binding beta-propeller fold protein YncE